MAESESITEMTVIPMNLGISESDALDKAIENFNSAQDRLKITKKGPSSVESFTKDRMNWELLQDWLEKHNPSGRIIAVTSERFDDNWLSHNEGRLSAISTAGWWELFVNPADAPGPHCYILLEFALASYFYSTGLSETNSAPHEKRKDVSSISAVIREIYTG